MQLEDLSGIETEGLIRLIEHEVSKIEIGLSQKPELDNINEDTKTEIIECCRNIVEALQTGDDMRLHMNSIAVQVYTLSLIIELATKPQT